jgi:hypothetical protein
MRTIRFVCAALWFFSSRLFAQHYLDFSVYKSMKDLAPELPGARLHSSLAPAGYELWEKGQLRMPADLSPDELTGVHIRVIRLHPPGESSSLFLFSPGYAPNLDFFETFRRPHRRGDSRDQNNRTLVLSVSQLREVILALRGLASRQALWERTANNRGMELSVALLRVDEDPHHCEVLLTGPEARSLESVVERITGRRNPFGPAAELIH